jgi:acyl-coenzyme A thioesterase PaaI-like protein
MAAGSPPEPGALGGSRAVRGESWRTRFYRYAFNFFPAYRGTGARVTYIAADWSEVRIRLPLNWRTRNRVGTIFGGSMSGAVDPVFMLMLMETLGPQYVVWDKAASIRFRRPGRETLFATFRITGEDVAAIRAAADETGKTERELAVDLVSASGEQKRRQRRSRMAPTASGLGVGELGGHLEHGAAEAGGREERVGLGVEPGGEQHDPRRPARAQGRQHLGDQPLPDPAPARHRVDVEIVELSAEIEEVVPVPAFERPVGVTEQRRARAARGGRRPLAALGRRPLFAVALGDQDHRRLALELAREEPPVARLHRFHQHEPPRIQPVVQPDQLGGQARHGGQIARAGGADAHALLISAARL